MYLKCTVAVKRAKRQRVVLEMDIKRGSFQGIVFCKALYITIIAMR